MVSVSVSVSNTGVSVPSPTHSGMPSRQIGGSGKLAYYSNTSGHRIVNAETGVPTEYRVGSLDEHLFFKVADATRRNPQGDADIYFYDSPEHYLRHRFSRIRYKSSSGSAKRDEHDKARKDEMLANVDSAMIHWSLVDSRGAPVEDTTRAFMQPRINPAFSAKWTARRAEHISRTTTVTDEE